MKNAFSRILLVFILAVIIAVAYFVWLIYGDKWFGKKETSQAPKIEVIEQGDVKIVKNITDGYQVTIPKEWSVKVIDRGQSGTNLRFMDSSYKPSNTASEAQGGCPVEIFVNENLEKLSLSSWLEENLPGGVVSKINIKTEHNFNGVKLLGRELGDYVVVYIINPQNFSIYEIVSYIDINRKISCSSNFDLFVNRFLF